MNEYDTCREKNSNDRVPDSGLDKMLMGLVFAVLLLWGAMCLPVMDHVYGGKPLALSSGRSIVLSIAGLFLLGVPASWFAWRRRITQIPLRSRFAIAIFACIALILGAERQLPLPKPIHPRLVPVEISIQSVTNVLSNVSRFYLLRVEDHSGRILLPAATFTNAASDLAGGVVVNNGHALYSKIPEMGSKLEWHWSGDLELLPDVTLLLRAGSSPPGSTLLTTVTIDGHRHSQVSLIPDGDKDATSLTPLIHKPAFSKRFSLLITLLLLIPGCLLLGALVQISNQRSIASVHAERTPSSLETGALFLLAFPFWCSMTVAVTLLLGGSVQRFVLPVALVLALITVYFFSQHYHVSFKRGVLWAGVLTLLSILLAALFWDDGWDTNVYHYPMVELLKEGWNPVYQARPSDLLLGKYGNFLPLKTHVCVVPKAQAYITAAVSLYLHHPESGNFTNLIFMVACGIIAHRAFCTFHGMNRTLCAVLALAIALNPIAVTQWQSGFVDGRLGSLLSISLLSVVAYLQSGKKSFLWYAALAQPMALCLKISACIYMAIWWFGLLAFCLMSARKHLRSVLMHLFLLGLLTATLGWHPYVTNFIRHGSPFYPVLAPREKTDRYLKSTSYSGPIAIKSLPRVKSFVASHILASPGGNSPFDMSDICNYSPIYATTHIGLYGPLHSKLVLPVALAMFFLSLIALRDRRAVLAAAVLLSIFAGPAPWYSRYVPQLYLFSALTLALFASRSAPMTSPCEHRRKSAAMFLAAMLLANSVLIVLNMGYKTWAIAANTGRALRSIMGASELYFINTDPKYMGTFRYLNHRRMQTLGKTVSEPASASLDLVPIRSSMLFYGLALAGNIDRASTHSSRSTDFLYSIEMAIRSWQEPPLTQH